MCFGGRATIFSTKGNGLPFLLFCLTSVQQWFLRKRPKVAPGEEVKVKSGILQSCTETTSDPYSQNSPVTLHFEYVQVSRCFACSRIFGFPLHVSVFWLEQRAWEKFTAHQRGFCDLFSNDFRSGNSLLRRWVPVCARCVEELWPGGPGIRWGDFDPSSYNQPVPWNMSQAFFNGHNWT